MVGLLNYNSVSSVSELLSRKSGKFSNEEAVVDEVSRVTYAQLHEKSTQLAAYFQQRLKVEKGDRIAISIPNCTEYVIAFYATLKLGAVIVPLNPSYQKEEIEYVICKTEPKVIITDDVEKVQQVAQDKNLQYAILTVYEEQHEDSIQRILSNEHLQLEDVDTDKDDLAVIMFTSGTTGQPKGAMLTQGNILYSAHAGATAMQATPEDNYLIPNPLFHIMGVTFMLRSLWTASTIVLMRKYSVREALKTIEREKVTIHPGVPTMFILELNTEHFDKYDLSSLRTGEMAAAPCPVEIVKRIRKEMNCNILVAYGATETSATLTITSFDDSDELRAETVGRAIPGVDIKVVNEFGKKCTVGEIGELLCRGPGVMKGYYKMPEETEEAFDEYGYFKTGDMAMIDENGYVRIVGRKKEMIIRGGFNIYPREIEEVLHEHPAIKEAAIVGIPHAIYGEVPIACISLKEQEEIEEDEVIAFLSDRFVKYKIPEQVIIFDDLPVTPSGKISKLMIKQSIENKISL